MIHKGYKIEPESNKIVITKNVFVGKCYVSEGLFKLNVVTPYLNEITMSSSSFSDVSGDLWIFGLRHVNTDIMKHRMNLNIIPKVALNPSFRCQDCVLVKHIKRPFKYVPRESTLLKLIH